MDVIRILSEFSIVSLSNSMAWKSESIYHQDEIKKCDWCGSKNVLSETFLRCEGSTRKTLKFRFFVIKCYRKGCEAKEEIHAVTIVPLSCKLFAKDWFSFVVKNVLCFELKVKKYFFEELHYTSVDYLDSIQMFMIGNSVSWH